MTAFPFLSGLNTFTPCLAVDMKSPSLQWISMKWVLGFKDTHSLPCSWRLLLLWISMKWVLDFKHTRCPAVGTGSPSLRLISMKPISIKLTPNRRMRDVMPARRMQSPHKFRWGERYHFHYWQWEEFIIIVNVNEGITLLLLVVGRMHSHEGRITPSILVVGKGSL